MDQDPRRPYGSAEDNEPERQVPARTPPPPKKPLAEFLAEFEKRLAEFPDQPATDAHKALEARGEGLRHQPVQVLPPLAPEPAADAVDPIPGAGDALEHPETPPEVEPDTGHETTPEAAGDQAPPPAAQPAQPHRNPGPLRRRVRGRRHRRRRH